MLVDFFIKVKIKINFTKNISNLFFRYCFYNGKNSIILQLLEPGLLNFMKLFKLIFLMLFWSDASFST